MGCFAPDAPAPVNYGTLTRNTLQAQVDLAPQQFAAESNQAYGQPAYTNLALSNLNDVLNGTTGGQTYTSTSPFKAPQAGWYDKSGTYVGGSRNTPVDGAKWLGRGGHMAATNSYTTQSTPGLIELGTQAQSAQREADINDVAKYGQQAHDAILSANPENALLLSKLNAQANEGLDAGSNLTPDEERAMQQQSRAALAARGLGGGNQAVADELLRQFNLGQTLLRQRQGFAQSVLGNNQQIVGDPFLQILGRPGINPASAESVAGNAGPSLFNPESPLAGNIASGNQQMAAAFADPSTISKVGAISNMTGQFIGSVASAFA